MLQINIKEHSFVRKEIFNNIIVTFKKNSKSDKKTGHF